MQEISIAVGPGSTTTPAISQGHSPSGSEGKKKECFDSFSVDELLFEQQQWDQLGTRLLHLKVRELVCQHKAEHLKVKAISVLVNEVFSDEHVVWAHSLVDEVFKVQCRAIGEKIGGREKCRTMLGPVVSAPLM